MMSEADRFAGSFAPPASPAAQHHAPVLRSGLPPWAMIAISLTIALVVLGILETVAIPLFVGQREAAVAAATTVSLPTQIAGLTPTADATLGQELHGLFESLPACSCFGLPEATVYVDAGRTHVLTVGAARMTRTFHSDDRANFVRGFWSSVQSSAAGPSVGRPREQDPGKLGGVLSCAQLMEPLSGEICIAVDAGALFVTEDTYLGTEVDRDLPTTARESVVHRR
jgi:hypothetical protein